MVSRIINVILFVQLNSYLCLRYDNYTLFGVTPLNSKHLQFVNNLKDLSTVNFWRHPASINYTVQFSIGPEEKEIFVNNAKEIGMDVITIIENVQAAFDNQTIKKYTRRQLDTFNWENFYDLPDIYQWLKDLKLRYPKICEILKIGTTAQGRDILAFKVRLKPDTRSTVIVEGGIHAREWISPAFVNYFLHSILTAKQSNNAKLKTIAETYEWYFVPIMNPDGYEYSMRQDRLWRKNRQPMRGGIGVDLNRNFENSFGSIGVSTLPSSDIYCGPKAFSEQESEAMAKFIRAKTPNLEYYLAFHSFGQYMIIPYAFSRQHLDNFDEVKSMCEESAKAINKRHGTKYVAGTAYDTVGYMTSGVSGCWVKKTFQVPYVVTFELRDTGRNGFALPPKEIIPSCEETMDGVLTLLAPRIKKFDKLGSNLLTLADFGHKSCLDIALLIICNFVMFLVAC